jgi:hypothetical protein
LKAPDAAVGKNVTCPKCKNVFAISPPQREAEVMFEQEEGVQEEQNWEEKPRPVRRPQHAGLGARAPQMKKLERPKQFPMFAVLAGVIFGIVVICGAIYSSSLGNKTFIGPVGGTSTTTSSGEEQPPIKKKPPVEKETGGPGGESGER